MYDQSFGGSTSRVILGGNFTCPEKDRLIATPAVAPGSGQLLLYLKYRELIVSIDVHGRLDGLLWQSTFGYSNKDLPYSTQALVTTLNLVIRVPWSC